MGDRYKQVCVFSTHEPSSYGYFHVLTSSHANPSFGALNYQIHRWHNEIPCWDAWLHSPWKGEYLVHYTQQWCGVVYELNPTFFDLIDDFLHYVTHSSKHFFCGGGWTWRLVVIFFFFHIGGGIIWFHKLAHINNPWFFRMIFIGLFIIRFIVINLQIGKVCKHGSKTSMIRSIPCPTILNDIFFSKISTCKKNGNLIFTQVSMQHPFTCATNILGERKWDLICHIQMLLVSYHPCMASFVRIIYLMHDIGVKDQCDLLKTRFHNVFHNFIFYELAFLHFSCMDVMSCNCCCESPH